MTQIASHRGGAALWPENSVTSFTETARLDVEQIEFDVQLSADGVPVIFHDSTLDRVTDGSGPVGEWTLEELKTLSIFRGGGRIMTLEEGLAILGPSHLVLRCEIKPGAGLVPYPGIVGKTLGIIGEHRLLERTVITSFHLPTLREVLDAKAPLLDVIWLVSDQIMGLTSPAHVAMLARGESITALAPHHARLRDGALEALRQAGFRMGAFGVLEDEAIEWAFRQQLEVFTTDRPDAAIRIREALGKAA